MDLPPPIQIRPPQNRFPPATTLEPSPATIPHPALPAKSPAPQDRHGRFPRGANHPLPKPKAAPAPIPATRNFHPKKFPQVQLRIRKSASQKDQNRPTESDFLPDKPGRFRSILLQSPQKAASTNRQQR